MRMVFEYVPTGLHAETRHRTLRVPSCLASFQHFSSKGVGSGVVTQHPDKKKEYSPPPIHNLSSVEGEKGLSDAVERGRDATKYFFTNLGDFEIAKF